MNTEELVHLRIDGHVATVTLDSPANRNALSQQLVGELTTHLNTAANTAEVRVVVVTHTGGTFCAGADLREAVEVGMEEGTRTLLGLLRTVLELPVPVIAVVGGHVRAGGVGLVGACDLALGSTGSTYAFSEAKLGLTPAIISLTTRRRMPEREAARLYLTGVTFDGAEAARVGLLTQAVDDAHMDKAQGEMLEQFAAVSPQGLRETKTLLNGPVLDEVAARGESLVALSARLFASAEAREGMTAFKERRPPRWA